MDSGFNDEDIPKDDKKRALYETGKKLLSENGYHEIGMDHFALETDSLYDAFQNGTLHRNFMGYSSSKTQLMIDWAFLPSVTVGLVLHRM
jgi:oxygen-independent coproporphyrinogen-3 oxidase